MGTSIYTQSVRSTGDHLGLEVSIGGVMWGGSRLGTEPRNLWDLTLSRQTPAGLSSPGGHLLGSVWLFPMSEVSMVVVMVKEV